MSIIILHTTPTHVPAPALPSGGFGILSAWHARYQYRRMLRDDLLPQPDSVLEDAGFNRATAMAEAQKPFWRA